MTSLPELEAERKIMAQVVKTVDMPLTVVAKLFEELNPQNVEAIRSSSAGGTPLAAILLHCDPSNLVYPEGWSYRKGHMTNESKVEKGKGMNILVYQKNESYTYWPDVCSDQMTSVGFE